MSDVVNQQRERRLEDHRERMASAAEEEDDDPSENDVHPEDDEEDEEHEHRPCEYLIPVVLQRQLSPRSSSSNVTNDSSHYFLSEPSMSEDGDSSGAGKIRAPHRMILMQQQQQPEGAARSITSLAEANSALNGVHNNINNVNSQSSRLRVITQNGTSGTSSGGSNNASTTTSFERIQTTSEEDDAAARSSDDNRSYHAEGNVTPGPFLPQHQHHRRHSSGSGGGGGMPPPHPPHNPQYRLPSPVPSSPGNTSLSSWDQSPSHAKQVLLQFPPAVRRRKPGGAVHVERNAKGQLTVVRRTSDTSTGGGGGGVMSGSGTSSQEDSDTNSGHQIHHHQQNSRHHHHHSQQQQRIPMQRGRYRHGKKHFRVGTSSSDEWATTTTSGGDGDNDPSDSNRGEAPSLAGQALLPGDDDDDDYDEQGIIQPASSNSSPALSASHLHHHHLPPPPQQPLHQFPTSFYQHHHHRHASSLTSGGFFTSSTNTSGSDDAAAATAADDSLVMTFSDSELEGDNSPMKPSRYNRGSNNGNRNHHHRIARRPLSHRRSPSGDGAAATLLAGGNEWIGMEKDSIPMPAQHGKDDDDDDDDDYEHGGGEQMNGDEQPQQRQQNAGIRMMDVPPPPALGGLLSSQLQEEEYHQQQQRSQPYRAVLYPRDEHPDHHHQQQQRQYQQLEPSSISPQETSHLMGSMRPDGMNNSNRHVNSAHGSPYGAISSSTPSSSYGSSYASGTPPPPPPPLPTPSSQHSYSNSPWQRQQQQHGGDYPTPEETATMGQQAWMRHMSKLQPSPGGQVPVDMPSSLHLNDGGGGMAYLEPRMSGVNFQSDSNASYSDDDDDDGGDHRRRRDIDSEETSYTGSDGPRSIHQNRMDFHGSADLSQLEELERRFEDRGFQSGPYQRVVRQHHQRISSPPQTIEDSPFANLGKDSFVKAPRSAFLPEMSRVGHDAARYPTYTCPQCKTRQREFFSVSDAPRQLEGPSSYLAAYFAIYVIASLFIFGLEEGWKPLDCIYFAVVTLTTAGLGDFVPTTDANKIICSVFIYFGVACIGLLLGSYIAGMLDERATRDRESKRIASCPNCARIKTLKDSAMVVRERKAFFPMAPNAGERPLLQRFMSERPTCVIPPGEGGRPAVLLHGPHHHHHHRSQTPDSRSIRTPDSSRDHVGDYGSQAGSSVELGGGSERAGVRVPTPIYARRDLESFPASALGSPVTRQILGRQSHTRHESIDVANNAGLSKTYGTNPIRRYSADGGFQTQLDAENINSQRSVGVSSKARSLLSDDSSVDDDGSSSVVSTGSSSSYSSIDELWDDNRLRLVNAKYVILTLRQALVNSMIIIAVGSVGFWLIEGFSFVDSWYYTTVYLTTVGYGDIVPTSPGGKLFATVYILVAGTILLNNMSSISMIPLELRKRRVERAVLTQFGDQLDDAALRELATGPVIQRLRLAANRPDGLDECTREMFSLAMLVRMGKVSEDEVRQAFAAFRRLDVNDEGVLNSKSIIAAMIQKRRQAQMMSTQPPPPPPMTVPNVDETQRQMNEYYVGPTGSLHVTTPSQQIRFSIDAPQRESSHVRSALVSQREGANERSALLPESAE